MLEAHGRYHAGEKLEDRRCPGRPGRLFLGSEQSEAGFVAKNVKPHLPHEVLAEKILHRVGFCVGFLAEKGLPCNSN
jgi:hypothetical protein